MQDAHVTDDGINLAAGQYVAAVQAGKANSQVFEITAVLHDSSIAPLVKARLHTFGRRYGWTVKDEQVYTLERMTIVPLTEQLVEQRGAAAYERMLAYRRSAR